MKGEKLDLFKDIAYKVLSTNRLTGTEGHKKAHRLIESFFEELSCPYEKEAFFVKRYIPKEAWIEVEEKRIDCVAYIGSKEIEKEAYVKREYWEGDIALIPDLTKDKALEAQRRGAVAILTYREKAIDGYVYGGYMGVDIPILSLKRDHIKKVEDYKIRLFVKSKEETLQGQNWLMELGKGPVIYLVAHMDTVHGVYGAVDNGVAFLLLLFLYEELRKDYKLPYRLRFLISDGRELGLEGVRQHLKKDPKHVYYCINLDGIGWSNPCVVYEDSSGYNGERINQLFYKHVEDLKLPIEFRRVKDLDGEHVPFKERGVQSLFLSSHPFTLRHTQYDSYDAINWDMVVMWYEAILSFLRRFHKL
ncbi:MAG: M28 family peptidase [Aquificaceae bacterium]